MCFSRRYDERMPFEPIVPEGHHLGASRTVDGAVTGHIFEDGTNELKGHAAWEWVDEPDEDRASSYESSSTRSLTPEEEELIVQEIFPDLGTEEREIFISGIHPACFAALFGPRP